MTEVDQGNSQTGVENCSKTSERSATDIFKVGRGKADAMRFARVEIGGVERRKKIGRSDILL